MTIKPAVSHFVAKFWGLLTAMAWIFTSIALVSIWLSSLSHERKSIGWYLLILLGSLFGLWLASGIEIAYTDLRDKAAEQIRDDKVRALLVSMQSYGQLVYEAREWITVILVVLLTYASDLDSIHIPFTQVFETSSKWRFFFTLIFTTVPAVWFAQAPAKQLAVNNSTAFIDHFSIGWTLFRVMIWIIEFLRLRTISEWIYHSLPTSWQTSRNLAPSKPASYMSSLQAYQYALHDLVDHVTIHQDGSAELVQHGTLHIISDVRDGFTRKFDLTGKPQSSKIEITAAFSLHALRERVEENCATIDRLKEGGTVDRCGRLDTKGFRKDIIEKHNADAPGGSTISFEMQAPFNLKQLPGVKAMAFAYRLEFRTAPGNSPTTANTTDWQSMLFRFPCRHYKCTISLAPGVPTHFAVAEMEVRIGEDRQTQEEEAVVVRTESLDKLSFEVSYPLPSAKYRLQWKYWAR
jgi:hypothetical protein